MGWAKGLSGRWPDATMGVEAMEAETKTEVGVVTESEKLTGRGAKEEEALGKHAERFGRRGT